MHISNYQKARLQHERMGGYLYDFGDGNFVTDDGPGVVRKGTFKTDQHAVSYGYALAVEKFRKSITNFLRRKKMTTKTVRQMTKLERGLLELTPRESEDIAKLWVSGRAEVHPYEWRRNGRELTGTGRGKFRATLEKLGLRDLDDWSMGTTANRGGQEGKWVRLTPRGYQKIRRVLQG